MGLGVLAVLSGGVVIAAGAATAATTAAGATAAATAAGATATAAGAAATASGTALSITIGGSTAATAEFVGVAVSTLCSGPVGWITIGYDQNKEESGSEDFPGKLDCYKAVIHDTSKIPSKTGMLLRDLIQDSRVKSVDVTDGDHPNYPIIKMTNQWNETFLIQYVYLENGELAGHVKLCNDE
ncbi:uncharacterized protein LOC119083801 isoform X1 [Bradysia coprophila]|uniref:uncharacterized protein LOC119083801 isoform X1 n=1 Tax=Bradysia coprophila TaxID=38358 RepID=UPI00187DCE67|nr:uncharacterized protein LOC119083801 isoform X1 [Bradysia coprophila]